MASGSPLELTLACWHYDRTEGLRDRSVPIEGVRLTYLDLPVEETFFRMIPFHEFDLAELSLSSYVISLAHGAPFVAVPAFPSRMFRHSGIYLNSAAGITAPGDLAGRSVGVAEYQLTANVWIRGILAEHYGVPVASVRYRTGGLHSPGRVEKLALHLPDGIDVSPIGPGQTLADLLVSGELDALYSPRTPEPLVIRRDRYERHRWLARSVLKAFEQARRQAEVGIDETAALRCATCCLGCTRRWPGPGPSSGPATGAMAWRATSRCCGPSCDTRTNRGWCRRGWSPRTCSPPKHSRSS